VLAVLVKKRKKAASWMHETRRSRRRAKRRACE
jgi:hypothetical protein